ncbi:MAG TPA: NADH-quinone oxidoreductase subunit L [Chthoniobacteraceae bacterium]|jgi:NADH-quinone oxidoreductase subunit L|nr:NADH-quinone oxidoreductase subunit L [Chthoniobacteraceae bacterium]
MTPWIVSHLFLIPAVPLLAAFLIVAMGRARRAAAASVAIAGQVIAFSLAVCAFLPTLSAPGWRACSNFVWFTFGDIPLRIGWLLDPLGAAMLLMITFVSVCIFVFSTGYMAEEVNFTRFFAYLSFFSAAMLGVVIANSLLTLFICWELVGLASYLLIGFYIERPAAAAAAKKAFITTRIGDAGLFLGILWLYSRAGTLLFYDHGHGCIEPAALAALGGAGTFIALLIFCGAMGKSGQFPLHVWLPDAMEGPTPVSALIHAATMVAAGVFLVARMYPLFSFGAVNGITPALEVVVWIGVITSLMAAFLALGQSEIKRILAYSTVSQLGLMMVSLGVGGLAAGIMHLISHGFFKALLFLGSGSVIHGCHHEQDIREMGGLRRKMPLTFAVYAIGMMALSGVPLLFAGAWTKEAILDATHRWPVSAAPYYLLVAGVFLTALYMTRQMIYVFFGTPRKAAEHAHESPAALTVPLVALASCTLLFSLVLTPAWPWLEKYLTGEKASLNPALLIQPGLFTALLVVAAGIISGAWFYRRAGRTDPLETAAPALYRSFERRFWIDELYAHTILKWSAFAARAAALLDRYVWDGAVRGIARIARGVAEFSVNCDERAVNRCVDRGCDATRRFGSKVGGWHSGQIQSYLRALGIGALALFLLYAWLA